MSFDEYESAMEISRIYLIIKINRYMMIKGIGLTDWERKHSMLRGLLLIVVVEIKTRVVFLQPRYVILFLLHFQPVLQKELS